MKSFLNSKLGQHCMSLADKGYKFISTEEMQKLSKAAKGGCTKSSRILQEYAKDNKVLELPNFDKLTVAEYRELVAMGLL